MSSTNRRIIIRFYEGRIWFDTTTWINVLNSNLPLNNSTLTSRIFYWEVSPTVFDRSTGVLDVSITNFDPVILTAWVGAAPKYKIHSIQFLNLNWEDVSSFLTSYNIAAKQGIPLYSDLPSSQPHHEATLNARIKLSDLTFEKGYVSFTKSFSWTPEIETIRINNPHIFPQLSLLLPYIAKLLKKKTINVQLKVGRENGNTSYVKCTSEDINRIDENSLQIIRIFQLDDTRRKFRNTELNNIFDPPPELLDEVNLGNIDSFEKELLFAIIDKGEVRNAKQLTYLSTLLSTRQKLFITVDPQFGFVFRITGDEMTHFVWELADSHATYIWSLPKRHPQFAQLKIIEQEFALLSLNGRTFYKEGFENKNELFLNIVNHTSNNNPMIDQFNRWRMRVAALLI